MFSLLKFSIWSKFSCLVNYFRILRVQGWTRLQIEASRSVRLSTNRALKHCTLYVAACVTLMLDRALQRTTYRLRPLFCNTPIGRGLFRHAGMHLYTVPSSTNACQ